MPANEMEEARSLFIRRWGEMAACWGVSRTMAEIHALLLLAHEPLNTDDVMSRLDVSRGSTSMTLRSLLDWGIISRVHRRGDRKEYFQAEQDVWKLFRTILRERKKREIEPLLKELHVCRDLTSAGKTKGRKRTLDPEAVQLKALDDKLDDMIEFVGMIDLGVLSGHTRSEATGVNDANYIIGNSSLDFAAGSAFVYHDDFGMADLADLVSNLPAGESLVAQAINNAVAGVGQITATDQPEGSLALVDYLLGDEAQRYFSESTYEFPLIKGVAADPRLPSIETASEPTPLATAVAIDVPLHQP